MVSSEKKLANAIGGKTARACDSCVTKRARWYCAADDAFFCQFCDTLVHSANPLARGHERVRLKVASIKLSSLEIPSPSWHQGFMKKSRTPRGKKSNKLVSHPTSKSNENLNFNPLHLVPEIESDQLDTEDLDEQLPYQVPVFDPFSGDDELEDPFHLHGLNGFVLPTDLELAKFAADVESLLGKSLDEGSFDIKSVGMVDFRLNDLVKVEEEAQFEAWEEEDEKVKNENEKCEIVFDDHVNIHIENYENNHNTSNKTTKMLKLDYEGIIAAWDDDRSPWTTGDRPELVPDDCWPECMGGCGKMQHYHCGDMGMMTGNPSRLDGEREARVSRYKKKRLTRLFSKKIRYEVRKLNAEKRPRMKGRFVKRTSFVT